MKNFLLACFFIFAFCTHAAYGKTYVWDSFTDTNGVTIGNHIPETQGDTNAVWSPGDIGWDIQSNLLRPIIGAGSSTMSGYGVAYPITISAKISFSSLNAGRGGGIIFRSGNGHYFSFRIATSGGADTFGFGYDSLLGGSVTTCAIPALSLYTYYPIKAIITEYDMSGYFDVSGNTATTLRVYAQNSTNSSATRFGLLNSNAIYRMDDFSVFSEEVAATPTPTITPTFTETPTISPTPTFTETPTISPTITITSTVMPTFTTTSTPIMSVLSTGFGVSGDWQEFTNTNLAYYAIDPDGNTLTTTFGDASGWGQGHWYYIPSVNWTTVNIFFKLYSKIFNFGGTESAVGYVFLFRVSGDQFVQINFPTVSTAAISVASKGYDDFTHIWGNHNQTSTIITPGDLIEIRISDDGVNRDDFGVELPTYTAPHVKIYVNGALMAEAEEWKYGSTPSRIGAIGFKGRSGTYQAVYTTHGLEAYGVDTALPTATPTMTSTMTPTLTETPTITATSTATQYVKIYDLLIIRKQQNLTPTITPVRVRRNIFNYP